MFLQTVVIIVPVMVVLPGKSGAMNLKVGGGGGECIEQRLGYKEKTLKFEKGGGFTTPPQPPMVDRGAALAPWLPFHPGSVQRQDAGHMAQTVHALG